MATPTFAGVDLTTRAERMQREPPQVRVAFETLPGVDGEFVQTHGQGGRTRQITGVLEGSEYITRALALAALRAMMDTYQDLYLGTYDTFVDPDGVTWDNCVLLSWRLSPPWYWKAGAVDKAYFIAGGRVTATIRSVEGP